MLRPPSPSRPHCEPLYDLIADPGEAEPAFVGAQGKTVFDPDSDIDDGGCRTRRPRSAPPSPVGAPN